MSIASEIKMVRFQHGDGFVAAVMTVASGSAFGSFISGATDVVQLLAATAALVVAVVTGLYTWERYKQCKRENDGE
jgi:hypothetical protein